jgi:hypothetical protein
MSVKTQSTVGVKRYGDCGDGWCRGPEEEEGGCWVLYDDYDALREEVELQRKLEEASEAMSHDYNISTVRRFNKALDALQAWREGNDETR